MFKWIFFIRLVWSIIDTSSSKCLNFISTIFICWFSICRIFDFQFPIFRRFDEERKCIIYANYILTFSRLWISFSNSFLCGSNCIFTFQISLFSNFPFPPNCSRTILKKEQKEKKKPPPPLPCILIYIRPHPPSAALSLHHQFPPSQSPSPLLRPPLLNPKPRLIHLAFPAPTKRFGQHGHDGPDKRVQSAAAAAAAWRPS